MKKLRETTHVQKRGGDGSASRDVLFQRDLGLILPISIGSVFSGK
jgi:hypothetical protein